MTVLGVGLGTLALGRLDDAAVRRLIGGIIVAMFVLHVWRKWSARRGRGDEALVARAPVWFAPAAGVLEYLREDGRVSSVEVGRGKAFLVPLFYLTPNMEKAMEDFKPQTVFRKPSMDGQHKVFAAYKFTPIKEG